MVKRDKLPIELIQKVKEATHILEIIGEHVVLRKSGAHYVGLCPFHSERTPSFSVSETKQLYHCYGCKKGGDVVTFLTDILGISFREAIEELAERSRIPLPSSWKSSPEGSEQEDQARVEFRKKQDLAFKLNRFTAAFFHQNLGQSTAGTEYLRKRGLASDSSLIREFYVGVAPDAWDGLSRHLSAKQAPLPLAQELGLIRPSPKRKDQYFDLFRNRIMFPILNLRGKVSGFGGRILGEDQPKYLNSPESFVFHKSKLLFGLYQSQKHIREQDSVILVEGYFDVLALHAAGFKNVVATCGTSLTPEHLNLFKRFTQKVVVLFDGDKAGVLATERAMEIGLEQGWVLYGAQMPEGQDPDEVLFDSSGNLRPEGKERMNEILGSAQALLDARIREAILRAEKSPEDRTQAIKQVGGWLAKFSDPVGKEVRIQLVQKELGISGRLLQEVARVSNPQSVPVTVGETKKMQQPKPKVSSGVAKISATDQILLTGLVYGGDYLEIFSRARDNLPPNLTLKDLFEFEPARDFVTQLARDPGLLERFQKAPESLLDAHLDSQVRSVLTEAMLATGPPISLKDFEWTVVRSSKRIWARFSQQIKMAISSAEAKKDVELQTQLMKEYLDVQRKMKEFINFYDEE